VTVVRSFVKTLAQVVVEERKQRRAVLQMDRPARSALEVSANLYAEFFTRKRDRQLLYHDSVEAERLRIEEMRRAVFERMEENYGRAVRMYRDALLWNHQKLASNADAAGAMMATSPVMERIFTSATPSSSSSSSSTLEVPGEGNGKDQDHAGADALELPRLAMRKQLFASIFDYLHRTKRVMVVTPSPSRERRTNQLKPSNIFQKLHNDAVERTVRRQQLRIARSLLEARQVKLKEWERNEQARRNYEALVVRQEKYQMPDGKNIASMYGELFQEEGGAGEGEEEDVVGRKAEKICDSFLFRQPFEATWSRFQKVRNKASHAGKIIMEQREAIALRKAEMEDRKEQLRRISGNIGGGVVGASAGAGVNMGATGKSTRRAQ